MDAVLFLCCFSPTNEQGLSGLIGAPGAHGVKGEKVQRETKVKCNDEIMII